LRQQHRGCKIENRGRRIDDRSPRRARVRAVTEANFGKVISPTRAPVKPAAVEAVALA
jgi:hypothetical protein